MPHAKKRRVHLAAAIQLINSLAYQVMTHW